MHLHWLCLSIHAFKFVKDKSKIISALYGLILYHCDNKGSKVLDGAVKHCVILQ